MADLRDLFGNASLTYEEFLAKAGEAGAEIGDTAALRADYESRIRDLRCSAALERALDGASAKNRDRLSKLIDFSAVTVDDEGVHGVSEQVNALRRSDPYLFETAPAPRQIVTGLPHEGAAADPDSLSDDEYYKARAGRL